MFRRVRDRSGRALPVIVVSSLVVASDLCAMPSARDEEVYRRYLDFDLLVTGGHVVPNWLPDGSTFWYVEHSTGGRQLVRIDPATNAATPLLDIERLRSAFKDLVGEDAAGLEASLERLRFVGPRRITFESGAWSYQLDLGDYTLSRMLPLSSNSMALVRSEAERSVPGSFLRERFIGMGAIPSAEVKSPDGRWIAGIEARNLSLRATVDGQKVELTTDGTPLAFWDVEGELWNPWSPDTQHLAAFKQHTEGMARIPSIEWLKPLERAQEVIAIPAGGTLYRSELFLVDMNSYKPVPIDLGDTTNQYLRVFSWRPDGSELILGRYNRVMSRVDIQAINATTGAVRPVMSEQSATFLTNHHKAIWGTDTGFTLLPDGSGFIWASERSGWRHLYYYDIGGKLVRQLTRGAWPVRDVVRIDQAGGWVYFTGHDDQTRPYDTHLYRVGLDGKEFARLTAGEGQHAINIAPAAQYFVDTYSTVVTPPRTELRRMDGTLIRVLSEAGIERLKSVGWVAPKEYVVKAADGATDLWVTMYFPYNFDPSRKYPVVEYIYAGPQLVRRPLDFADTAGPSNRPANFNRALANLGFIVVVLDARGTPERSKAFHDAVYMNWGQFEIADHAGAIRQLAARLGFLDLERVGVWGVSWGGTFTFRAMTQASDLYKVGISQVPGFDARRYTLYEVYLGMPQTNKRGYDAADVFSLAPKLKGDLLLIGGMSDTGTQTDLFKMSETLIRLGKQHWTMSYANSGHGTGGRTAEYDMELKKRFFVDHLMRTEDCPAP